MTITQLLDIAVNAAFLKYKEINEKWTNISWRLGKYKYSTMHISLSIQKAGQLDVLLRSLEDDLQECLSKDIDPPMLALNTLQMLSEAWIGHVYEITRRLNLGVKYQ